MDSVIWEKNKNIIRDDMCFIGELSIFDNKKIYLWEKFNFPNDQNGCQEFVIGSLSKILIAHLAFEVLRDLKINLSTKLSFFLKELPYNLHDISVEDLIYHRSGIENFTTSFGFYNLLNPAETNKEDVYNFIISLKYQGKTTYNYSNSNYFLLGIFLERLTTLKLSEIFQKYICTPLGLRNTRSLETNDLRGYTNDNLGVIIEAPILQANSILFGAGNVSSTMQDLITYFRFINDNKSLLHVLPFKKKIINGNLLLWHGGICPGFQSLVYIDSTNNRVLLSLSNSDSSLREEVLDSLYDNRLLSHITKSNGNLAEGLYEFEFEDRERIKILIEKEEVYIVDDNLKIKLFCYDNNFFAVKNVHENYFKFKKENEIILLENYSKKGDRVEVVKAKLIN